MAKKYCLRLILVLKKVRDELLKIPGVGKEVAKDLHSLGIHSITDLRGKNPQILYERLEEHAGQHVDRCMIYTFRCAVYFASNTTYDPEKLTWWNWKDI